jgi:protein-S-isoprenylcysteine O-methyltransferase Ste14
VTFTFSARHDNVPAMKATAWEFKNRALIFGLIFGASFFCYSFDHPTSAAWLSDWLAARTSLDARLLAHFIFGAAAVILALAALARTWGSAYLRADIVYASEVKSASLVADGPYRHVRNPLYF